MEEQGHIDLIPPVALLIDHDIVAHQAAGTVDHSIGRNAGGLDAEVGRSPIRIGAVIIPDLADIDITGNTDGSIVDHGSVLFQNLVIVHIVAIGDLGLIAAVVVLFQHHVGIHVAFCVITGQLPLAVLPLTPDPAGVMGIGLVCGCSFDGLSAIDTETAGGTVLTQGEGHIGRSHGLIPGLTDEEGGFALQFIDDDRILGLVSSVLVLLDGGGAGGYEVVGGTLDALSFQGSEVHGQD